MKTDKITTGWLSPRYITISLNRVPFIPDSISSIKLEATKGKKKKRKRIWKIKTEGDRKEERIQFFFVVDNHRVDGRGRTMHHDGQLHKQDSRRLIIGLTGYPMYSISYLRFPRLWLHQFSLKKWRSVTGIVTSQINCELADVIERWIQ